MTLIKLHMPDDLADKVRRVTSNAETYIIDLLRSNPEDLDRSKSLAHEYRMAALENAGLLKDFAHIDLDGWQERY